jgi:hypothetical protein
MMDGLCSQDLRKAHSHTYEVKSLWINVMAVQLCDVYSFVVLQQQPAVGVERLRSACRSM